MAFSLISVLVMSTKVERVFLSAKRLLTLDRNALIIESLKIYECLRKQQLSNIILWEEEVEGDLDKKDTEDTDVNDSEYNHEESAIKVENRSDNEVEVTLV